jgi:hypothetical protein
MQKFCKIKLLIFLLTVSLFVQADDKTKGQKNINSNGTPDDSVNIGLIKLKPFTPPKTLLITGTVETIEKETLKFQTMGKLKTILNQGVSIKGQTFDLLGTVIDPGTLIAQQYTDIDKANLEGAKVVLEKAKLNVKKAEDDFNRNKKLIKDHAVSQKQYEESEVVYLQAKSDLTDAYQNLAKTLFILNSDFMYSGYDAEVEEVFQSPDVWYESFNETITIQMMNPIVIKVPIRYISDINHLKQKPIIYSPSSNARIEDWICEYTELVNNRYYHYFVVPNEKISFYNNLPEKLQKLSKIGWVSRVIKFNDDCKELAVAEGAIEKENGKEFVWRVKEKYIIDEKNIVNYKTYVVNKVYVQTNNKVKRIGVYKVVEVNSTGELKLEDTVIWDDIPPKGLKDGDTVLLDPKKWKLAPGEKVKVLVNLISMQSGFYVPIDSITLDNKGGTFVTLKDGKMVPVNIEGNFANLKLISGKNLKEDTEIRQNPNDIDAVMEQYYQSVIVK